MHRLSLIHETGGIISDTYLGKFKTILILSMVYCVGNIVLSVTALPGVTGGNLDAIPKVAPHWWGAALGLFLLAVGTGGIKVFIWVDFTDSHH